MMNIKKNGVLGFSRLTIITIFSLLSVTFCRSQNSNLALPDLDKSIRYGKLDNGMRYFIKPIAIEEPGVSIHFYSNVGKSQEESDQLEFVHLVEHLAFESTERFPEGIVEAGNFHDLGLNNFTVFANTSPYHIRYIFKAPRQDPEVFKLAFSWFKEITNGLKFEKEDVDKTRRELREEVFFRNGEIQIPWEAATKLESLMFPCGEDYTGVLDHYENFKRKDLIEFYKKWYRPDLMTLVVVGKIDSIEALEDQILTAFSELPSTDSPVVFSDCGKRFFERPPQFHKVELPRDTLKFHQIKRSTLHLVYRDRETDENLHNSIGLKRLLMMEILTSILDNRFEEVQNFELSAGFPYGKMKKPSLQVIIEGDQNESVAALEKAISLLSQLIRYGVTPQEWEKTKQKRIGIIDQTVKDSQFWIGEIENLAFRGESLPSDKQELLRGWLQSLKPEDIHAFAKGILGQVPDIGILAPVGSEILNISEEEMRTIIDKAAERPIDPYDPVHIPDQLMSEEEIALLPKVGIKEDGEGPDGARQFVLENGVRVVLKQVEPASGNPDRVSLRGFSTKGASCFANEEREYISALNAPHIANNSGVKDMTEFKLKQFLLDNTSGYLGIHGYAGEDEVGVLSVVRNKDLETMLQLVYLYFTSPNFNKEAFEVWKAMAKRKYWENSNFGNNDLFNFIAQFFGEKPEFSSWFGIEINGTLAFENLDKTDIETASAAFKALFGNAEDFTFILRGAFDSEKVIPLVRKYLGNLPEGTGLTCDSESEPTDSHIPTGPVFIEFRSSENYTLGDTYHTVMFRHKAEDIKDWREHLKVTALGYVIGQKILALREQKGYPLYHYFGEANFDPKNGTYTLETEVHCNPEIFPSIRKEVFRIISELQAGMVTQKEFEQAMRIMVRSYNAKKWFSHYIMITKLQDFYRFGKPYTSFDQELEYIRSLKKADIMAMANKYLTSDHLYEFTMKDRGSGLQ